MTDARKTRTILRRASSALLLLLMLCACDGTLFHTFFSIGGEWISGSAVEFVCGGEMSPYTVCGLQVEARTDASYRYKNLVVQADYFNSCDSLLACDTITIVIYDDDGRRIGATAGVLYQQESDVVMPKISFSDSVIVRLNHLMPDDNLRGVHDIGIRLMNAN